MGVGCGLQKEKKKVKELNHLFPLTTTVEVLPPFLLPNPFISLSFPTYPPPVSRLGPDREVSRERESVPPKGPPSSVIIKRVQFLGTKRDSSFIPQESFYPRRIRRQRNNFCNRQSTSLWVVYSMGDFN